MAARAPVARARDGPRAEDAGEDESVSEQVSRQVFSTYDCRSIDRGIVHPGDIAEPSSLRCGACLNCAGWHGFSQRGLVASGTHAAICAVSKPSNQPRTQLAAQMLIVLQAGSHHDTTFHDSSGTVLRLERLNATPLSAPVDALMHPPAPELVAPGSECLSGMQRHLLAPQRLPALGQRGRRHRGQGQAEQAAARRRALRMSEAPRDFALGAARGFLHRRRRRRRQGPPDRRRAAPCSRVCNCLTSAPFSLAAPRGA